MIYAGRGMVASGQVHPGDHVAGVAHHVDGGFVKTTTSFLLTFNNNNNLRM